MKRIWTLVFLAAMTLTTFCAAAAAEIRIGGGGAACKGFFIPYSEVFEAETGIHLAISPSTPDQGVRDLVQGKLDIATAALPFSVVQASAFQAGIKVALDEYRVEEIGINRTLVFVNKANRVTELSRQQLQDIFSGKVKNWNSLGGPDREIVVVWSPSTTGQNEMFVSQILDGAKITAGALIAADHGEVRDKVARTPGAIGIGPQGYASLATRNPLTPEVTSAVIAITRAGHSKEIDKLLDDIRAFNN
jgi:phosphate transport system substrate-binding protein